MDYLITPLALLLMLAGLVGTVLPLLPGTTLILLAAIGHKLLLPDSISWVTCAVLIGIWIVSVAADIGGTLLGTRLFGGTKWGMAGAGGGAVVGMFISLPAIIVGSILGAFLAERLGAARSNQDALKAGAGAALGFVLSAFARLACALAMIALFVAALLIN